MPAEKLTRGRLTQILVMMGILLSAFFWRTAEFYDQKALEAAKVTCYLNNEICETPDNLSQFKVKHVTDDEAVIVNIYTISENDTGKPVVKINTRDINVDKIDLDHFYWQFKLSMQDASLPISIDIGKNQYVVNII